MNTPSHAILNLAILGDSQKPQYNMAIALGGILPDLPIFVFYIWARFIEQMPASQIWSEGYYQPFWQNLIAVGHSFPLLLIALLIVGYQGLKKTQMVIASMLLHNVFDVPVHHDDAHRHFFPFSDYRFVSPISYWDPNHHGDIVAGIELVAVLLASVYVFRWVRSPLGRALLILVNVVYGGAYVGMYWQP